MQLKNPKVSLNSLFFFFFKIRKKNRVLSFKQKTGTLTGSIFLNQVSKNGFYVKSRLNPNKIKITDFKDKKNSSKNANIINHKKFNSSLCKIKDFLFTKKNPVFSKDHLFTSFEKLLSIIKPLFSDKCQKIKSMLIDIFFIYSKRINVLKMLTLLDFLGCKVDFSFKQVILKIIFFVYKIQNFYLVFPYIRSLSWKKNEYFPINFLLFTIKFVSKNEMKLFIFELNEIFLIIKKFIESGDYKISKICFKIYQQLLKLSGFKFVPRIQDFNHVILKQLKKPIQMKNNYPIAMESFFKNIKLFNYFEFIENIFDFLKIFNENQTILKIIKCCAEKNFLDKKTILNSFSFINDKIIGNSSKILIEKVKKLCQILLKNLTSSLRKKKFEKFFKYAFLEEFFGKDLTKLNILDLIIRKNMSSISYYTEKVILECFKYLFSSINVYSILNLKRKTSLKKSYQILQSFILRLKAKSRPFLSQVSGLLKWSINNLNLKIRIFGAKIIHRLIPIFHIFNEKILLSHLGVILVNNLDEKNKIVLKYHLKSICQMLNFFPKNYSIPPIKLIFSSLIPLLKNNNINLGSGLIFLLYSIIEKKSLYIPKKDVIFLCFNLIKIQKKLNLKNRKFSVQLICKISKIYGSSEISNFLIDSLEKSNGIYRISIIVILTGLAYDGSLHLILPKFYQKCFIGSSSLNSYLFKSLIYIFEFINSRDLLDYINSLGVIIEKELFGEKKKVNPLLFLLIGKYSQKFQFFGFEKRLVFLFKFILINTSTSSKLVLRYMYFALEKLILSLNPIIWWNFVFQGLIHRRKKIRCLYWKFHKIISLKKKLSFFFLKYIVGSKKNLLRDANFFF